LLFASINQGKHDYYLLTFIRESLSNFQRTGALMPSSPWLARKLSVALSHRPWGDGPVEILEAGPGTGALTTEIVRHLRPGDHLTLCEINSCFVRHLENRLLEDEALSPYAHQITIHHGAVEDIGAEDYFDHIISGLPFNNFPPALVRKIFHAFMSAAKPSGTISFFEYIGIRKLKAPFLSDEERERLDEVESIIKEFMDRGERHMTLLNLPPAWACTVRAPVSATVGAVA
jgi:phospholipid N-methyltransferase